MAVGVDAVAGVIDDYMSACRAVGRAEAHLAAARAARARCFDAMKAQMDRGLDELAEALVGRVSDLANEAGMREGEAENG